MIETIIYIVLGLNFLVAIFLYYLFKKKVTEKRGC